MEDDNGIIKEIVCIKQMFQLVSEQLYLGLINQEFSEVDLDTQQIFKLLGQFEQQIKCFQQAFQIDENSEQIETIMQQSHAQLKQTINSILNPRQYNEFELYRSQLNQTIKNTLEKDNFHQNQVINLVKKGLSFQQISQVLKIPYKNVSKLWRSAGNSRMMPGRRVAAPQMQNKLYQQLLLTYELGESISLQRIQELAIRFSKKRDFKGSKGWAKNFIKRYKLNERYTIH